MSIKKSLILGLLIVLAPALALADEEAPSCDGDGQTNVTFSDGNNIATMCVNQGSGMEATPDNDSAPDVVVDGNYD